MIELTEEQKKELISKDGDLKIKPRMGRPPLFSNPEDMQQKIDEYFAKCKEEQIIPCIAELAYEIGIDRQRVYDYAEKDDFADIIKRARDFILSKTERKLQNSVGNVGGTIFLAKNYGYKDEKTLKAKISIEDILED